MLRSAVRILKSILLLLLLCAGMAARAQDDLVSRGIETFRETCLMADPRFEKVYQWAADRDLKIIQGQVPERGRSKAIVWEVAASGSATVQLRVVAGDQYLNCQVYFGEQRDSNRRAETFFLDEMKRHPNAKQQRASSDPDRSAHFYIDGKTSFGYFDGRQSERDRPYISLAFSGILAPPDVALARTFATPERSYRLFVNSCLARFPDIDSIAEHLNATGWQRTQSPPGSPAYWGLWSLYDPFDEMSPYGIELRRSNAFRSCNLGFDVRAALPMERLIRDYALVRAENPHPEIRPRPGEKIEYYSAPVAGMRTLFSLRTDNTTHDGELSMFIESSQ